MATSPASSQEEIPLPTGFSSIEQIRDYSPARLQPKPMVNVIGFVKDVQPPIRTTGTDFKCAFGIMDHTNREIKVDIFEKVLQNMPNLPNVGDLVLIRNIKAQLYRGNVSLMKHSTTEFRFLASTSIPRNDSGHLNIPWQFHPPGRGRSPSPAEVKYVVWASNYVDRTELPSSHQFQEKMIQAMKTKDKFSCLKDVKPENFYDILGQVIKLHDEHGFGHLTMYLSDYTYNTNFHNYVWGSGVSDKEGRDGDKFDYISPPKVMKDWPGPFGRMTIQLTLFDEHAQFVRECMKLNTWVLLKNVHIRYGKTGGVLEGYMRGDAGKMNVSIVKLAEAAREELADEESRDPRCKEIEDEHFKDAVQRKADYMKKFECQKAILAENPGVNKRKHDGAGSAKSNSKKRRDEKRAAAFKNAAAVEAKMMKRLGLNENIRCNNPDEPIVSFSEILKPRILVKNEDGQQIPSPFTCVKYRANIRIVDFFPHKIQDFAIGRRPSEYDILSDYSGGEDTDREEDMRIFKSGNGFAKHIWEWRFALQVEDASSKDSNERLWLIVDNHAAQGLLNLNDDATNLRRDPELLSQVKEQLFKLWGDLEELKSAKMEKELPPPSLVSEFPASSPPPRKAGEMPDADSDAENEPSRPKAKTNTKSSVLAERDSNISMSQVVTGNAEKSKQDAKPKNKAFTCCIRQYGVKVDEEDPAKADAGDGKRWQRMFGLFGTHIV
ncbi:hypothetical protein N431DRAFT_374413 [Stipitochalara longipes BDJ]|nr:hypothetical protein N431DRAFT_374413 [Stipitochalara longipes BDJ]